MYVKYHITIGLIATLIILLAFPPIGWFYALIIFLASFLIDFDHYLWYAVKKGDWNPFNAYRWMIKKTSFFRAMDLKERMKYKTFIILVFYILIVCKFV